MIIGQTCWSVSQSHISHTCAHTHTHTDKALCTVFHSSRGQYCAPKPFRGAASRKMTPCCPWSPQPRLVTPVSQGPAEGPIPQGLPLTPHYLPGPNANGGSSPWTMGAAERGKEMSQGSLTTEVRPPDLQGWSHWASLCKHRVSK